MKPWWTGWWHVAEIATLQIARLPLPASDRLRTFMIETHKATVATMLDQQKVHEMVSIALEEQWPVIERHLDRIAAILAMIIKDGIASGEFANQDPDAKAELGNSGFSGSERQKRCRYRRDHFGALNPGTEREGGDEDEYY